MALAMTRKTTDGGNTWVTVQTISGSYIGLTSIYFIDANTGTVAGENIYRTTNGGSTWQQQTTPPEAHLPLWGLQFINANTGFGSGNYRTVLFTTNGGSTWLNRPCGWSKDYWLDLFFFNASTGIIAGQAYKSIMRTTNAGLTWDTVLNTGSATLYGLTFADNQTGYCAGYGFNWDIYKTTNSGINWSGIHNGSVTLLDIKVVDTINVFSIGYSGTILKTSNGGANWVPQISSVTKALRGLYFVNSNTGWITGDTGILLKTTNGGITAIQPISSEISEKFSLSQNYPNPFNPSTKIKFMIPLSRGVSARLRNGQEGRGVLSTLKIYNSLGVEVTSLFNQQLTPGTYEIEWNASNNPSGIYFYKLTSGDFTETRKMALLK